MQASVLIVEDESELAELVQLYLEKDGIEATIAGTAEEGMEILNRGSADLVVLDINLPGMDGFEFLREFRMRSSTPIIIVSAREADEDIVMGLGMGADEFVTKPFAPKVLVARIRALLRRARGASTETLRFGPYRLDVNGYSLMRDDQPVVLSSKEFEVLRHLAMHPGTAIRPDDIYSDVWQNEFGDVSAVAVYVRRIRQKIEEDPTRPYYVQTIHGSGYRFNPDALASAGAP